MDPENQDDSQVQTPPPDDSSGTPPAPVVKTPNPMQPRVDELTRNAHEARREAEYWKSRATAQQPPAVKAEEAPKKPTVDDFNDYAEFVEALTDWKAGERVRKELDADRQRQQEGRRQEVRSEGWGKSVEVAKATHADFETVLGASTVYIAEHVVDLLQESEVGGSIMYHLAKNPGEADKLNNMTPKRAAIYMGRLETQVEVNPQSASQEPPKEGDAVPAVEPPPVVEKPKAKTTTAPAPVKPSGSNSSSEKPLKDLPMDEYVERRKKQGASWTKR